MAPVLVPTPPLCGSTRSFHTARESRSSLTTTRTPSYRPAVGNGEGVVAALDAFSTQVIDRLRADGAEIVCVASLRSLHLLLANVDGHAQGRGLQLQPHEALGESRAALQSGLRAYRLEGEREHRYEEVEEEDEGEDCEEEVDQ